MIRKSPSAGNERAHEVPTFTDRRRLNEYLASLDEDTLTDIAAASDNADRRRILIEALHKAHPEMNGAAEPAAERVLRNKQELDRKAHWMGDHDTEEDEADDKEVDDDTEEETKTKSKSKEAPKEHWLKSTLLAPFRAVKWAFTEHPYLSTAATALLLYYTGYGATALKPIMDWVGKHPDNAAARVIGGATSALPSAKTGLLKNPGYDAFSL
jgi:hypothetical protein